MFLGLKFGVKSLFRFSSGDVVALGLLGSWVVV